MYQLKKGQEAFTVVEGALAGRSFAPGKIYDEIPPGTTGKFMEIKKAAPDAIRKGGHDNIVSPDEKPAKGDAIRKGGHDNIVSPNMPHHVPKDKEVKI